MLEKHQKLAALIAEAVAVAKEIETAGGAVQSVINSLRDNATLVDLRVRNYAEAAPKTAKK